MENIVIYNFEKYDVATDSIIRSRRMGTREAIMKIGCTVLEDTAITVDLSAIQSEIPGLTKIDFHNGLNDRSGFQTQVK